MQPLLLIVNEWFGTFQGMSEAKTWSCLCRNFQISLDLENSNNKFINPNQGIVKVGSRANFEEVNHWCGLIRVYKLGWSFGVSFMLGLFLP